MLITGASGFIGRVLCKVMQVRGDEVIAAVRKKSALLDCSYSQVEVGEIHETTDWSSVLTEVDIVIHLAARVHVMRDAADNPLDEFRRVNTAGTEHLARSAVAWGVKRMVYVSTIKVNGEESTSGRIYTEQDIPAPIEPYAISKWEAEQTLQHIAQNTDLEIVIVRPTLAYGPGVKGNFARMMRVVAQGIPLPFASVRNQRDLIYVGNLVDALATCATHPAATGQTYLLSDGEPVSTPELIGRLAQALGVTPHVFPFSPRLFLLGGKLTGRTEQVNRLLGSFQVDSGKIRTHLNWTPPYTLQQGLQATAEWYRKIQ